MTAGAERSRTRLNPDPALANARLQAHHAAQLLASFAGALLPPRDDDGHRSLCWDDHRARLSTGSTARTDAPMTLHLDPATLHLTLDGVAGGSRRWSLDGVTLEAARTRLEADVGCALPPPEYALPHHPVAEGAAFRAHPVAGRELAAWFAAAYRVLRPWADRADAGPLRCWPHHFDLATLLALGGDDDGPRRTIGCGMTPGDDGHPAPYGYVTPWPYPWTAHRPPLRHGYWHTEEWLGAVLPAPAWLGDEGTERVTAFYADAVDACLRLHGAES